jgi:tetratricopeptide (TPR) repeat protein
MDLGTAALEAGDSQLALRHFESGLDAAARAYSPDDPFLAELLTKKAKALLATDDHVSGRTVAETALSILDGNVPPTHPTLFELRLVYAEALIASGANKQAEEQIKVAIAHAHATYGQRDTALLYAQGMLSRLYIAESDWLSAESLAREVLRGFADVFRAEDAKTMGYHRITLTRALYGQGRFAEAAQEAREAVAVLSNVSPGHALHLAAAQQALSDALVRAGEYAEAEFVASRCLNLLNQVAAEPWRVARAESTIAEALIHRGEILEAKRKLLFAKRLLQDSDDDLIAAAAYENERRLRILDSIEQDGSG